MSTDICRWLFLLFFLTTWTKSNSKEIRVVCYYTNWSVYRPGTAKFSPQNINPYLCTHLIYAFGGFTKENTLKPFDKYQDIEKGGYAKFTGLKTYNKNLKTMLAIGGWNEGSSRFSPMVANPDRRKELIKNAIKFLRQNHFDGLDLDWEYPSFRDGGKSRDRDNYAQLVQEMREEFERESEKTGRSRLLLTMAVPAGIEYINKGYDVPKLTKYLDWMNILSYDYHSAFEPAVNHHAPLYPLEEPSEYNYDTELNIDYTIEHYLEKGADPNKLVLGIPTYGRSYTLFNPDANEIGAPADGPGDMGEATRENGYLAYYEICENIKSQDWEVEQPNPDVMGPYAYKDNQWVGYDDDAIARKKAAYVAEKNLGGIMFWSIDNDDFRGTCHGKPYPIIESAKEALISAYGLTDENLISPPSKTSKSKSRTRTQTSSKSSRDKNEDADKKTTSSGSRRRNRIKSKTDTTSSSSRAKIRRKESRRTTEEAIHSSLELVTPSYTTPAPPSTPDMGGAFKCEDEGFYPHPKDCKKYFWCLSGPGELGIVAHQFTCPAGLYFNKAADSCDYTRNVLCNKKVSKTTTTTTEASTTSKTPSTTTSRAPPKITAATSRTTVFRTSTTAAYDDEDEYEDEEEDEEEEESTNSEEDPRVIKELLDLIKKAGGIEELEKQLKIHDGTTPSSISKSLVERVLGKTTKAKDAGRKSYFFNRNSRGPQNEGIKTTGEKDKQDRGRLQYTTINRQRTQKTEKDESEEDNNEENDDEEKPSRKSTKKQPEYVNIRRGRLSTTTEIPEEDSKTQFNRNKILGEEEDDDDEEAEENEEQPVKKKSSSPQYVNIRRQKPSTTEETSTSKYTVIRRGTTPEPETVDESEINKKRGSTTPSSNDTTSEDKKRGTVTANGDQSPSTEKNDAKSKYKILRRGTTTEAPDDESGSTLPSKKRGTTPISVQDVSDKTKTRGNITAATETEEKYKIVRRGSSTETPLKVDDKLSVQTTLRSSSPASTTQEVDETTKSGTDNPIIVEHILITSPESLTIKTTASLSSTNRPSDQSQIDTKLPESTDVTGEGVDQSPTPQLFQPRPFAISNRSSTSTLKPVTESSTRVTKVSDPNYKLRIRQKLPNSQTDITITTTLTTEKPTPFRTRAPSRYKQTTPYQLDQQTSKATIRPAVRARKRFSTTTERNSVSYEEYDIGRTYRPSELADLSSLTAVDFTGLKNLNRFESPSRPRRPRPSTTTTTTTNKPEETLKTGSRTLPLARKLLDGTTFGKGRRVISPKPERIEDQVNSSSDTTNRIKPFSRAPLNLITSTTEATSRPTLRNRKVVRRFRPTISSKLQNSDENLSPVVFKKRLVRPSSTASSETENLIENASSNSLYNRRFTRPTSSTTRSGEVSTTTESLEKTTHALKDDEQNETSDDVSAEEGENIRLSESNIRENSNVNNNNVLHADDGKVRKRVLKRIRNKVDDEKATTEPNIIIRTRKIVRKLQPTEATITSAATTTESVEVTTQGRKKKIIRRLRPITPSSTTEISTEKTLFIRGRPFVTSSSTETLEEVSDVSLPIINTESREPETVEEKTPLFKPSTSRYKTITRTTTLRTEPDSAEELDDANSKEDSGTTSEKNKFRPFAISTTKPPDTDTSTRAIDRSKYSILNRGTTSTTEKDVSDLEEEYKKEDVSIQSRPKYRIFRPTTFHDEDQDEAEEEEEGEDENDNEDSHKYRILNPLLEKAKNLENDEEALKIRIYRPPGDEAVSEKPEEVSVKVPSDLQEENDDSKNTDETIEESTTKVDSEEHTESSTEQSDSKKEEDSEETTTGSNSDEDIVVTTIRNYVNPILSRQRNRPAFVRPKFTTQNPLRPTSDAKPRYRTFSRATTSRPTKILLDTEENQDVDKKSERKFIPKGFSRTRYQSIGQEPQTETKSEETSPETIDETLNESSNLSVSNQDIETTSERKFVPKNFNRVRYQSIGQENQTEATSEETSAEAIDVTTIKTTTESSNVSVSATTPEVDYSTEVVHVTTQVDGIREDINVTDNNVTTTDSVKFEDTTASVLETITLNEFIQTVNDTESNNVTEAEIVTPEVTTAVEITTKNMVETSTDETTINHNDTTSTQISNTTTETTQTYLSTTAQPPVENELDATTINYSDTSIASTDVTTPETSPVSIPKSTLRSIQNRPRYNVPKRLTSTESSPIRKASRFNQRNRGQTTKSRFITPSLRSTTPTAPLKNRLIYRYSTTEKLKTITKEKVEETYGDDENPEEEEGEEEEEEEVNEELENEPERQVYTPRTPSTSPRVYPSRNKPRVSNKPEGFSFKKTTETPKVTEDLKDIDTEAVKNRNKNLFSKKRKMNTPHAGNSLNQSNVNEEKSNFTATTESTTETTILTTTPAIPESATKPTQVSETTEYLTTLHHIFAETELSANKSTTTEATTIATENVTRPQSSKVEKLIEVNRIVEVHGMNNTDANNDAKVVDKVGVINRITVVKVVDPDENEIIESTSESTTTSAVSTKSETSNFGILTPEIATVKEIPNVEINGGVQESSNPERQDRKFEIYGQSKVIDYGKSTDKKDAEIIDGRSQINIITPRPYYSTEASTISLEALFQNETPKPNNINVNLLKPSSDEELLETGNSRYINVRVLGQQESQLVPVRVPKEEDYITMKAEVIEVTPKTNKNLIKIVPIQVEMSRKLIVPSDFNMKLENGVPKVNFQIIRSEN